MELSLKLYPWAPRKYLFHKTSSMRLLATTNLASTEILVFSFCLVDVVYIMNDARVIVAPFWLLKSPWSAKAASNHHFATLLSSARSVRCRLRVHRMHCTSIRSFLQSSLSGHLTLLHIKILRGEDPGTHAYRIIINLRRYDRIARIIHFQGPVYHRRLPRLLL